MSDDGAVTAEFAVVMPAIVLFIVAILAAAVTGASYLACADAARVVARSVAAGEAVETITATVADALNADTSIEITADWLRVTVSRPVLNLGGFEVAATAVTKFEPGINP